MFKIPDWEEDTPKSGVKFEKKAKKKSNKTLENQPHSIPSKPNTQCVISKKQKDTKETPTVESQKKPKKRKFEINSMVKNNVKGRKSSNNDEEQILNTDIPDEVIINAKKKKFNEALQNDDKEDLLFKENKKKNKKKSITTPLSTPRDTDNNILLNGGNKINHKKEKLRKLLQTESNRSPINVNSNKLRQRMLERLKAAQFRYLNEKLYTSSGSEAQQLFQNDPTAFQTYHQGYRQQLKKWPVNPLDVIVKKIIKMPKTITIADMGCGEAALSKRTTQTVRSFDLVATAPGVEACDMAHTPLLAASVDVVVYCLALMGTDLTQYLVEANRVLKMGGHLLIAEVESRFDKVENFTTEVERLGFKLKTLDKSNQVFFFMEFTKIRDPPAKKAKLPVLSLKPCLYKKR